VPAGGTGTSHVARLISEQAHVYVAPEVIRLGEGQPRAADIWSLGAVSYLILTGEPPAADLDGLYATLKEHDSAHPGRRDGRADPELDEVVRNATRPSPPTGSCRSTSSSSTSTTRSSS
jgi:serine/threonine protein kinase